MYTYISCDEYMNKIQDKKNNGYIFLIERVFLYCPTLSLFVVECVHERYFLPKWIIDMYLRNIYIGNITTYGQHT